MSGVRRDRDFGRKSKAGESKRNSAKIGKLLYL
jgi:hypothetical protein